MPKGILIGQNDKNKTNLILMNIAITKNPNKMDYTEDDKFDPTGMVITAAYGTGVTVLTTAEIKGYKYSPSIITSDTQTVKIIYSENGRICTANLDINVTLKPRSISITTQPTQTSYVYDDSFDKTGMVVKATYSNGKTEDVTDGISFSPKTFKAVGQQVITIFYKGISTTLTVQVDKRKVAVPSQRAELIYDGTSKNPRYNVQWLNFNSDYIEMDNSYTSETNAGEYSAIFYLNDTSLLSWEDGTIENKEVPWTISKAQSSLSFNIDSITIAPGGEAKLPFTKISDGEMNIEFNTTANIFTTSINGSSLSIIVTENAAQANYEMIVYLTEGQNYFASEKVTISIQVGIWSWGSETEDGDADWWVGLKNWIVGASTSELAACVGKTKSVTLTSAVQGTTTHLVRCIGYNCDHNKNSPTSNTLTFQTSNTLAEKIYFNGGQADMLWVNSQARNTFCKAYYDAFPGKAAIVTTIQKTAQEISNTQQSSTISTEEQVFLISSSQIGFSKDEGVATSQEEFDLYNIENIPYQYYTTNESRIKNLGDTTTNQPYWLRSLDYLNITYCCTVNINGRSDVGIFNGITGFAPAFVI